MMVSDWMTNARIIYYIKKLIKNDVVGMSVHL